MRRLYLFRHAKAEPHGARPDHERVLDERGRRDAAAMGERLAERGELPDLVLCSTSARTLETWKLAGATFDPQPAMLKDQRIYEAPAERLLEVVQGAQPDVERLMLVGHNPGFEDLVRLLADRAGARRWSKIGGTMPTAAIAVLEADAAGWRDIGPGSMRLVDVLSPKDEDA
jgi:phosphohistidine phosphatase